MLRFLFLSVFIFSSVSFSQEKEVSNTSSDSLTFSEKHIDPVLRKGTDLHSGISFLAGALASWGTRSYDDSVREQWVGHQKMSKEEARIGDLIGTGVPSLLVIGSQYLWDPNESHFQSHARGFIYGGLAIYTLKTAFGRNRPGGSENHQSFPSGHTAITFMTATQLTYAYGWPAALVAFPIAAFTGASRLADDAHWFSDTIGGAFLGYYVGRATFYDSHYIEETKKVNSVRYDFIPSINSKNASLSLLVSY